MAFITKLYGDLAIRHSLCEAGQDRQMGRRNARNALGDGIKVHVTTRPDHRITRSYTTVSQASTSRSGQSARAAPPTASTTRCGQGARLERDPPSLGL